MSETACQKNPTPYKKGPELVSLPCSITEKKTIGKMVLAQMPF